MELLKKKKKKNGLLKRSYNYLWLAVSVNCFSEWKECFLFSYLGSIGGERSLYENQFFADTSSICYKWILLKNVSVMHWGFHLFPSTSLWLDKTDGAILPPTGPGPTYYPLFSRERRNRADTFQQICIAQSFFCHRCQLRWIIKRRLDRRRAKFLHNRRLWVGNRENYCFAQKMSD